MTAPTGTVDYFRHFVADSKTKSVLKSRHGNDGYAFWFQLLELSCKTDEHYYDCNCFTEWEYLLACTGVTEDTAKEILDLLAGMGEIDAELWDKRKVVWCERLHGVAMNRRVMEY